jgi:hypothetical protein
VTARETTPTAPPRPPTADLPGYGQFEVRYYTGEVSARLLASPDFAVIVADVAQGLLVSSPADAVISAEHLAPDMQAVVNGPVAGGTWSGECGSTRWVTDPDGEHRRTARFLAAMNQDDAWVWQPFTNKEFVRLSQSAHIWQHGDGATDGGFHVECQQAHRHEGLCQVEMWRWDARAGMPLN